MRALHLELFTKPSFSGSYETNNIEIGHLESLTGRLEADHAGEL
jgi:hypothetical protein